MKRLISTIAILALLALFSSCAQKQVKHFKTMEEIKAEEQRKADALIQSLPDVPYIEDNSPIDTSKPPASISGIIAIIVGSGDVKPGAKIDVLLTTKWVQIKDVPVQTDFSGIGDLEHKKKILYALENAHQAIDNQRAINAQYVKASTKTGLDGKFSFNDVSPGRYFLVVTYPARIGMNVVFWQHPITVQGEDVTVELSNDNLTLPSFFNGP
jgi:hypothetical protein